MKNIFGNFQRKKLDNESKMWYNKKRCDEILAQPVEHTPFKREVEGSNPSYLTKFPHRKMGEFALYDVPKG